MTEEHEKSDVIKIDELIIRRSDLDDEATLNEIIVAEEMACLDQLYNHPRVLKLMETSYLSITILDKDENIIGCMVFDSACEIITGMNDFMHENLWEDWMYSVFKMDCGVTPYNSLWLKYVFISRCIEGIDEQIEAKIVEKVFKHVYNTAPELEFILFHLRKEASSSNLTMEYINSLLLSPIFKKLEKKDLPPEAKENLNLTSEIYLSDRSRIIEVMEIRDALEQDHDDLVEIGNMQSELNTNIYGEYFIAELIANQTEDKKAIVAQVGLKAKGLMSLTTDIEYGFLAKNFELETYDNLCSAEFMDAIRHGREEMNTKQELKEERRILDFERKMADEKLICSIVANRI